MMDRVVKLCALSLLAIALACAGPALARSRHGHAAKPAPAAVSASPELPGGGPVPTPAPRSAAPAQPAAQTASQPTSQPTSQPAATPSAPHPAAGPTAGVPQIVAFDGPAGVIELRRLLVASHPDAEANAPRWYVFKAVNTSDEASVRVLMAGQPPDIGLSAVPRPVRPAVVQVASVDPDVTVENTRDYGRHGFRVTLPAKSAAMMAVRVEGADVPPSVLAWTEPALAAHNRWVAIFVAAVAGLIAAAAAIAGGLALLSRHTPPRWAGLMLSAMFLVRLTGFGLFDGSLITPVGGPFGLQALFSGLALAAGLRLLDTLLPLKNLWPKFERWGDKIVYGLIAVAVLAYLGVPLAALLIDLICIVSAVAASVYVIQCARKGAQAARALAPGVLMFALFALVSTFTALGGFGAGSLAPDIAGGFLATGAVLLVLALVAGEGGAHLMHLGQAPAAAAPPPPVPHAAIEAIGASFQGVFELDLGEDKVVLSREAAGLFGLGRRVHSLRCAAWLARIHPDDRPVYEKAMADFAHQTDFAFRIEFRARDEDGRYLWFELRAAMKGPVDGPAERCVGLIADVTMRKETEAAAMDRTMRDAMTGLGNSVALMEALETFGLHLGRALYALVDVDGFKAMRAAVGDACCDEVLARLAERLERFVDGRGSVYRVGATAFAVLLREARDPAGFGEALLQATGEAYRLEGHTVLAPVSVGIAEGRAARAPLNLVNNAEVALRFARFKGGAAAVVFATGMEMMAPSDADSLEAGLYRALDHGEIDVCYQPIVRMDDRTVAGFAAVPRWNHPEKGPISPLDLIAHSEDGALMTALGRFTLKRAVGDLAEWQRYFPLLEALFVGVRLSRRQSQIAELDDFLCTTVKNAGLVPNTLLLEIAAGDFPGEAGAKRLSKLRRAGVGLIASECGLDVKARTDVACDAIKIDKRCLMRPLEAADVEAALSGIIAAAHAADRAVIADGVESEDDAERLARLGCEMAQGFLFSDVLAVPEALNFIAQNFRATDGDVGRK